MSKTTTDTKTAKGKKAAEAEKLLRENGALPIDLDEKGAGEKGAAKGDKLTKTQTWILRVLSKADKGPMTRREIAAQVEKLGGSTSNGRVPDEAGNYGALVKRKCVKFIDAADGWRYEILAAGRKALKDAETK